MSSSRYCRYLTILVNFLEASDGPINWLSKLWVQVYGVWTVLLLCVGFVGFNGYDYERCPSDNVSMIYADNVSLYEELCHQEPVIPISIMGTLDYGWFILLVFTTPLVASHPPPPPTPLPPPCQPVCSSAPSATTVRN